MLVQYFQIIPNFLCVCQSVSQTADIWYGVWLSAGKPCNTELYKIMKRKKNIWVSSKYRGSNFLVTQGFWAVSSIYVCIPVGQSQPRISNISAGGSHYFHRIKQGTQVRVNWQANYRLHDHQVQVPQNPLTLLAPASRLGFKLASFLAAFSML